jgi:hypothetical protein
MVSNGVVAAPPDIMTWAITEGDVTTYILAHMGRYVKMFAVGPP